MQGGYLSGIPLHDRRDPSSWSVYYATQEGSGIGCRVHGLLTGDGFKRTPAPANASATAVMAFASERVHEEAHLPPVDRIALAGPISAAALGLDAHAGEVTLGKLTELAKAPSPRTRSVVALALRRMRNPGGIPVLKSLLGDADEYVRKQAAWAIGNIGTPGDAPDLVKLLQDPAERVRDFAAFALARLGDDRGIDASIASLSDEKRHPIRRGEAAIALADGVVNLHRAAGRHGSGPSAPARWSDPTMPKDRPARILARVRETLDAITRTRPHVDLRQRCEQALDRIKRFESA